jgi:hypothetical protein
LHYISETNPHRSRKKERAPAWLQLSNKILPSQNKGQVQRILHQLVWCQNIGNSFQTFGKTILISFAGSKPSTNLGCHTKILACPNIGVTIFWLALKLAWQRLMFHQA